jgi:hypothetical protein
MSATLAMTALLLGLAGAPHCTAMCGAACGGVVRACGGPRPQAAMLAMQTTRVLSYAAAGALVAASVSTLGEWGGRTAVLRPLWGMVHVGAFALGLWLLWRGRQPGWLQDFGQRLSRPPTSARVVWLNGPLRAAAFGSLWVAWPCGLLQSALVVAALGSGAIDGAVAMALFAIASSLGLWFGPALWLRLAGAPSASVAQVAAVRLAGLALAGASAWALWHGMATQLGLDWCL